MEADDWRENNQNKEDEREYEKAIQHTLQKRLLRLRGNRIRVLASCVASCLVFRGLRTHLDNSQEETCKWLINI